MKQSVLRTYAFIKGDYRLILRDSMMIIMFTSPLLMGLGIRIILPYVSEQILHLFKFDLSPYFIGIGGLFIQLPALMYGMVAGFIILDERDDGVLHYLTVTPLSRDGYLLYRTSIPSIAGIVASALFFILCDLVPYFTIQLLPLLFLASLGAPLISLFLASFARDKVEALTMAKAASITFLPSLVVFFTDSPLQFLCGITPSFWAVKGIIALYAHDPIYYVYVTVGILVSTGYLLIMTRKFMSSVL